MSQDPATSPQKVMAKTKTARITTTTTSRLRIHKMNTNKHDNDNIFLTQSSSGTDSNRIGEVLVDFANSVETCPCPPSCFEVKRSEMQRRRKRYILCAGHISLLDFCNHLAGSSVHGHLVKINMRDRHRSCVQKITRQRRM